jgi:hypothetical protein
VDTVDVGIVGSEECRCIGKHALLAENMGFWALNHPVLMLTLANDVQHEELTHKGVGGETATTFDPFHTVAAVTVSLCLPANPCPLPLEFRVSLLLPALVVLAFLGAIWDGTAEVWQTVLVLLLESVFLFFMFLFLLGEELVSGCVESGVRVEGLTEIRLGNVWKARLELGLQCTQVSRREEMRWWTHQGEIRVVCPTSARFETPASS